MTVSKAVFLASGDPHRHSTGTIPGGGPVALAPVANRPLLVHALDSLKHTDVREVAVVVDPSSETRARRAVRDALSVDCELDLDVVYIGDRSRGSLASSLAAVKGFVGEEPFILHLNDSISRGSLAPVLSVAPLGRLDALLITYDGGPDIPDAVTDLAVQRFAAPEGPRSSAVPAGVYVFGAGIFEAFDGANGHSAYELKAISSVGRMSELGGQVDIRTTSGWWRYDERPDALLDGNRFALERLVSDFTGAHLRDVRIQGDAVIHPTAQVESTTVRGPATIGPGARIKDSYIGPYTSVGEGVVIEGAELENSIVFPGASLRHLGSRLEASVIGPQAKISRDFRLPKALRLTIGEGAEISLT
ncbi:MAG: NTP transferase domain-containing protein [Actinomycetota bacterium]|nr:NTP transferase domain-containing protein [Actinomycetota bacterium]